MYPNPNSGQGGGSVSEQCAACWQMLPLFARFILYAGLITYTLSWFIWSVIKLCMNVPYYVVFRAHIWSLLTAPFICDSLLTLLFSMMAYLPYAMHRERQLGTAKYILYFLINGALLESLYACLLVVLAVNPIHPFPDLMFMPTRGLWPLFMLNLVVVCNQDPDMPRRFFFCPCEVKSKYFPWVFFCLFSILFQAVIWDLFLGIMFGYLHHYKKMEWTVVSDRWATKLECTLITGQQSFISLQNAGSEELPFSMPVPRMPSNTGGSAQASGSAGGAVSGGQPVSAVQTFQGQGFTLGGESGGVSRLVEMYNKPPDPLGEEELV